MVSGPIKESSLIKWIGFSLVFMLLMFSRDYGLIYIAMVFVWLTFLLFDTGGIKFPIEKSSKGRLESVFLSLIAYAVFLLGTTVLTVMFLPSSLPTSNVFDSNNFLEIIKYMATGILQASGPILQESKILLLIGWGLLIPIVETVLFNGKVFEALYDSLRKQGFDLRKITSSTLIVLLVIIGAVSALYHLTSKNMETVPLMITFMFFFISGVLVVWKGHLREAILIHIIGNSIAVLTTIGVI